MKEFIDILLDRIEIIVEANARLRAQLSTKEEELDQALIANVDLRRKLEDNKNPPPVEMTRHCIHCGYALGSQNPGLECGTCKPSGINYVTANR